jgi:hypothetical protein
VTLKINRVPDSPNVDSRVFTRMVHSNKFDPVTLTFDIWPWKSIGFQIVLRTKYICTKFGQNPLKDVDSRVFTRMLRSNRFDPVTLTFDIWPWKSKGFQNLLRTKYVQCLVKIHWRMLILECSQGCYGRTDDGRTNGRTGGKLICPPTLGRGGKKTQ